MTNNTIAAISTPIGSGGISIIRMSGKDSLNILSKIFKPKKKTINDIKSHTITYGEIISNKKIIDEVLVSVMKKPHTYTKEDIVEINCHGGIIPTKTILELLLSNGAILAEPGEFTKRAFLNGRLDLSQAEAICDIINSKTDLARQTAVNQLEGSLSNEINKIKSKLLDIITNIEANIDYPEYDIEEKSTEEIKSEIEILKSNINTLIKNADNGKIIREGIKIAIIGKPNVGKSSLLNILAKQPKAIVTNIPGTTRDIVEEYININGIPVNLIDTAGIRDTQDTVEKIGINKSKEALNSADLILLLFDNSIPLTPEDYDILNYIKNKLHFGIINKSDLPKKLDESILTNYIAKDNIINISAEKNIGIDTLKNKIYNLFINNNINSNNNIFISNVRHKTALINTIESLNSSISTINNGLSQDFISIDLKNAYSQLGEITGETLNEDIISNIFKNFCLGK